KARGEIRGEIIADGAADDDEAGHDGGWRRHLIAAAFVTDVDALGEIDLPIAAEAGARCAGRSVDRDEPRVDGADEDATTTCAVRRMRRVEPGGHAARGPDRDAAGTIDLGVVPPALAPRLGVEGDDAVVWRAEIQRAIDHQRSGLEGGKPKPSWTGANNLAGPIGPGNAQALDVPAIDLAERGVSRPTDVVAVARPFPRRDGSVQQRGRLSTGDPDASQVAPR